jgi:hypothetical protein
MKFAAVAGNPGPLSILFEKSCVYCGARFRVLATQAGDQRQQQEYECPECGKSYQTEAAGEPEVQLLRRRTDGKVDRYQETMF